jgi:hypothetical protein
VDLGDAVKGGFKFCARDELWMFIVVSSEEGDAKDIRIPVMTVISRTEARYEYAVIPAKNISLDD